MFVNYSDSQLILQWQSGNDKAFETLYNRYAIKLLAKAYGKTGSREIATEVSQEVFLGIFLKKKSAHEILNLPAFLYTMVRNKVLDYYRQDVLFKKYEFLTTHSAIHKDNSTMETIEVRDLERHLAHHIDRLPTKCRTVFQLSRFHYLSNKEIATRLNISENTVEQHMRRALRLLRSVLAHLNGTPF